MFFAPKSDTTIAILSIIRLSFVPLFFIAASAEWFPRSDALVIFLVGFLAFTSGYIFTVCLQVAPTKLPENYEESSLTKQANLLNFSFCISMVFGTLITFPILLLVE